MTSDTVTAMAIGLGIGIDGMENFTVGGIFDVNTEFLWRRHPEARVYEATQDDFDKIASL